MSRLGGGIGTRGPGETKLETDRRRILERVSKLESELRHRAKARATRSKARIESDLPLVSLVGYTNAGKSTLFNAITDAGVLVEDQLFATLDSTVRRTDMPNGRPLLISDTVGFVRRLPHQLVEAFRSTLEEVNQAALLVHVVDGADENPDLQIEAVRSVLREIGAGTLDELLVVNKTDIADATSVERLLSIHEGSTAVSAVTGEGVAELLELIAARLEGATVEIDLVIPYERGDVVSAIHDAGEVLSEDHVADGTRLTVKLPKQDADRFSAYS